MKKIIIISLVAVALLVLSAFAFREQIFMAIMGSQIAPEVNFAEQQAPAAPNYEQSDYWAALPEHEDPSDQMPRGVTAEPTGVAVFFVHPTSYFGKTWNQALDDTDANWVVDERILRHQATVFNSCCEVYAPRYRQATFFSFMDDSGDGDQALALAYQDVVAAFRFFLSRLAPDQPFIVAGHSQGTRHATQLVREHVTGTALQDRLVAAYLIGFFVTHDQLGDLPACDSASQYGCAVGWNAMDGEGAGAFGGMDNPLCTNPLNWRNNGPYASSTLNAGAIGYPTYGPAEPDEDITAMPVEIGVADAECVDNGQLAVQNLTSTAFPARMFGNSMHVYDYSLFHMNLRQNAAERIAAFINR